MEIELLSDPTSPVIMVDDNEDDILLAQICYTDSKLPNPFVGLNSGKELLAFLDKTLTGEEEMPGLVLLDINMPGMDGFETLQAIRAQDGFKTVPVILMLTHSDRPEDERLAMELGANGFHTKPHEVSKYSALFAQLAS